MKSEKNSMHKTCGYTVHNLCVDDGQMCENYSTRRTIVRGIVDSIRAKLTYSLQLFAHYPQPSSPGIAASPPLMLSQLYPLSTAPIITSPKFKKERNY